MQKNQPQRDESAPEKRDDPVAKMENKMEEWFPALDSPQAKEFIRKVRKEGRELKDGIKGKLDSMDAEDLRKALGTTAKILGIAATAAIVWRFFSHGNGKKQGGKD